LPNWCYNTLTITGTSQRLVEFEAYASRKRGKILHEDAFKPYPRKFKKADKEHDKAWKAMLSQPPAEQDPSADLPPDGFNNGGLAWCIKNWGTKWGICEPKIIESSPTHLIYEFDTAWAPPIPLVKVMSRKFPDLHFELYYEEPGMSFQGTCNCDGGEITHDEVGPYEGYEDDEEEDPPSDENPPTEFTPEDLTQISNGS